MNQNTNNEVPRYPVTNNNGYDWPPNWGRTLTPAPRYHVTYNNGYSWGSDFSRSSSESTVVPEYYNPVGRSLSNDTIKR